MLQVFIMAATFVGKCNAGFGFGVTGEFSWDGDDVDVNGWWVMAANMWCQTVINR